MPNMAQRLAVLLVLASVVAVALADMPTAETAKYKEHEKHQKEPKDKHYKEYKPDYKPDHEPAYKPSYKHEEHYDKPHDYDQHYAPSPPYGGYGEHYDHEYPPHYSHDGPYEHGHAPAPGYGSYGEPSPYDGGYWGGMNGRQIIRLQAVYAEKLLNTSLVDSRRRTEVPDDPCLASDPLACDQDFGLICGIRHHEQDSYGSYGSDYASGSHRPIFQSTPTTPTAIAKGYVNFEFESNAPLKGVNLVTFNGHQKGYKVGDVNGFIKVTDAATACNPILGANTEITFNEHNVPLYLIIGKINLPVDPAIVVPAGGFGYIDERKSSAKVMGDKKTTDDYKTTPEGNKYKTEGSTAYVLNEKDNTLCGLTLVARGAVTVTVAAETMGVPAVYTGFLEWPIVWTDVYTTLPLLIDDPVDRSASRFPVFPVILPVFDIATALVAYVDAVVDRFASICKANNDIPWITPASFTLDVTRVPAP